MSAGERVHCVGVLRLVLGEALGKHVVVEVHKGIEDDHGVVLWAELEQLDLTWEKLKDVLSAADYKALLRVVEKVSVVTGKECKSLKKSRCVDFDEKRSLPKGGAPRLI